MRIGPRTVVRTCSSFVISLLIGTLLLSATGREAHAKDSTFVLQSAKGRVEIQVRGKGKWKAVGRGVKDVSPGDHVRTGPKGSVHIITDQGTRIALGPDTEVVLQEPEKPRGWRVTLGRVWAAITGAGRLEVRGPGAIAAAEGTVFQVDVGEDGTTVLTVAEGTVQFYNDLGNVTVLGSQQSTARVGEPPTRPIVVDPSSLMAWEANLQTLMVEVEYPLVSTNPLQLKEALLQREEAAASHPDDASAQAALAEVLVDLKRTDEALQQAQQAIALDPEAPTPHGVLGFALLQAGRPAEAREQFALASQTAPGEARWQIGLGLVALGQRESGPAVGLLRRAAEMDPSSVSAQAYLSAALLRSGDLPGADAAASEAVRLDPESGIANSYLAYVRLAEGRPDAATAAARIAVRNAPESALAHEALGTSLMFAGQLPEAGEELDRALALDPISASTHLARAKLLAARGELEMALQEAQVSVGLDPESAPARSTLGLLFLLNKDSGRAGREFQRALAADPSLSEARTGWGAVLAKRGRFREAMEQQKLAVSADTDSASAQNNLGGVYASLGRMDLAIEHLQRAIELQPNWGLPYANLAAVYLELNRIKEALEAGEKAVALGNRSPFAYTVLARIYLRQGRVDRALTDLRQALALDPEYPLARFELAQLYVAEDRSRDAVREIVNAVTIDPSAMLETRRYARTENALAFGSYGAVQDEGRHSNQTSDGRLSYYGSWLWDTQDGWREVNQDVTETFLEVIAGYQSDPKQQLVLFGTHLTRDSGLPGPETASSPGDLDDQRDFRGTEALLAFRQRISRASHATVKYSYTTSDLNSLNPDSMTGTDDNPFRDLTNEASVHSPEIRLDTDLGPMARLSLGYARARDDEDYHGIASSFDPGTGEIVPISFAIGAPFTTDTVWLETTADYGERVSLTLGGYWGKETGASEVASPKIVVIYRPDPVTWWALGVTPVFRADAAELAPVEALVDSRGLSYLDFTADGLARTYELRYQRQGGRSNTITASLAYQDVWDLLIDVIDPAWAALPTRVLVEQGDRWVAEASYEQWISSDVSGRVWARWQSSSGGFPDLGLSDREWPYTPEWTAGARLDYINAAGWCVGLVPIYVGERYADAANSQTVDAYALVNLEVQYQRNLHEDYFLYLTNLTGSDYEFYAGFPEPGRSILAGLRYRF